jgi:hypothetical protein
MPSTLQHFKTWLNGGLQFVCYYRMLTGLPDFFIHGKKFEDEPGYTAHPDLLTDFGEIIEDRFAPGA